MVEKKAFFRYSGKSVIQLECLKGSHLMEARSASGFTNGRAVLRLSDTVPMAKTCTSG